MALDLNCFTLPRSLARSFTPSPPFLFSPLVFPLSIDGSIMLCVSCSSPLWCCRGTTGLGYRGCVCAVLLIWPSPPSTLFSPLSLSLSLHLAPFICPPGSQPKSLELVGDFMNMVELCLYRYPVVNHDRSRSKQLISCSTVSHT